MPFSTEPRSPSPRPSPAGRGGAVRPSWTTWRGWLAVAVNPWLPLPAGDGRGEGERTVVTAQALPDTPDRRVILENHSDSRSRLAAAGRDDTAALRVKVRIAATASSVSGFAPNGGDGNPNSSAWRGGSSPRIRHRAGGRGSGSRAGVMAIGITPGALAEKRLAAETRTAHSGCRATRRIGQRPSVGHPAWCGLLSSFPLNPR